MITFIKIFPNPWNENGSKVEKNFFFFFFPVSVIVSNEFMNYQL